MWAIAALVLVCLVVGFLAYARPWNRGVYSTRAGETSTVGLQVGNVAYLNSRSELRNIDDDKDCRYELVKGEALFDIEPNAVHPCRVVIGGSEIRVLGTRFNVRRDPDGHITVTVLQGVVEVRALAQGSATADWSRILHANEQLEYRLLTLIREPHPIQGDAAIRWHDGLYTFDDESVTNVVAELSRYTDAPIRFDPRLGDLRIAGGLNVPDVKKSIFDLEGLGPIRVREHDGAFSLEYRPEAVANKN
jgi:transmembrane sensor